MNGPKDLKREAKTLHANNSEATHGQNYRQAFCCKSLNHDINIIQIKKINKNFCK